MPRPARRGEVASYARCRIRVPGWPGAVDRGAELIVRSGTGLAARLGVSPLVIGLTIVAVGTSTPELAVGIDAAVSGNGAIAVGNIAGTNVVNILLILGLSAAVRPLALRPEALRLDMPAIAGAGALMMMLSLDRRLTRVDGCLLVLAGLTFSALVYRAARRETVLAKMEMIRKCGANAVASGPLGGVARDLMVLAGGIATIVLGADLLVGAAVALARLWQVSDAFIGLTIVAIGTSAPELVTTVVSTIRNERDIAIGNILGSSVYNIFFILGLTCLVPSEAIPVTNELIRIDIPVMVAVGLACVPVFLSGRNISRREGSGLAAGYLLYLGYLVVHRT